jgi:hypothetical protein
MRHLWYEDLKRVNWHVSAACGSTRACGQCLWKATMLSSYFEAYVPRILDVARDGPKYGGILPCCPRRFPTSLYVPEIRDLSEDHYVAILDSILVIHEIFQRIEPGALSRFTLPLCKIDVGIDVPDLLPGVPDCKDATSAAVMILDAMATKYLGLEMPGQGCVWMGWMAHPIIPGNLVARPVVFRFRNPELVRVTEAAAPLVCRRRCARRVSRDDDDDDDGKDMLRIRSCLGGGKSDRSDFVPFDMPVDAFGFDIEVDVDF